jgi:hypothetical protein
MISIDLVLVHGIAVHFAIPLGSASLSPFKPGPAGVGDGRNDIDPRRPFLNPSTDSLDLPGSPRFN